MDEVTEKVELYCKRCKSSLHIFYRLSGTPEREVLPGIEMKCPKCSRIMTMKQFTERDLLSRIQKTGKVFR